MAPWDVEVAAGNCEGAAVPERLLKLGCAHVGAPAFTAVTNWFAAQEPVPAPPEGVEGAQAVPLQASTWFAAGAVDATGFPWRPTTVCEVDVSPRSPASCKLPGPVVVAEGNCAGAAVPERSAKDG